MKALAGVVSVLAGVVSVLAVFAVVFTLMGGYVMNIVKLTQCDFEQPIRAEAIRIIGIPVAPVGIIAGYMDIKDGKEVKE